MAWFSGKQRMGVAAILMAGSVFLSRFMGLIRDKVISYYHGATVESDIYFASFVIPDFLNYLLAGGYFSITLIPLLAEYFEKNEESGWRFLSSVLCWVFLGSGILTTIAWFAAPWLAHIAAPGFSPDALARLAHFLRIILPAQVFFLLGACLSGVLYMRRQFRVPALTPLVYNASIILGGWLMIDRGMEGFCWGVLFGAIVGSFLLPLLAVREGGMQFFPSLHHSGVKRFIWLALPLMVGQSVVVLDEQFIRIFGSFTGEGAVSLLNYARRIMLVPVGVVAQAAGVASYPFLAALVAKKQAAEFSRTLNVALQNTVVCIVPLSGWMIVAAEPTIRILFQQGGFTHAQTMAATPLLQCMLAGVVFWGIQQIVGRAFYAHKDTITPAVSGTVVTVFVLPIYWWLGKVLGVFGVALAGAVSVALYTMILSVLWRRRFGVGAMSGVAKSVLFTGILSLPAAMASSFCVSYIPRWGADLLGTGPLLGAVLALGGSLLVFGVVYIVVVSLCAPRLLGPVRAFFVRRRPV